MKTLIVSAAKAGHVNQCIAMCEILGWTGAEIVRIPSPGRMTPKTERWRLRLLGAAEVWRARPRVRNEGRLRIAASGRVAEGLVADYRTLYGEDLFAAFSGRPRWKEPIFDFALAPSHSLGPKESVDGYSYPAAQTTIMRRGVPVRASPPLSTDPRGVFAMIGGTNKAYRIEADVIAAQVSAMLGRPGARPFVMTFSRRTPPEVEAELRWSLGPAGVTFVHRNDRAGFERALGAAAEFVITPDSLSMICEACDTGRPVRVFDLAAFDPHATTAACVRDLIDGGEIALAPHGVPRPSEPGYFRAPRAAVAHYLAWETAHHAA